MTCLNYAPKYVQAFAEYGEERMVTYNAERGECMRVLHIARLFGPLLFVLFQIGIERVVRLGCLSFGQIVVGLIVLLQA